MPTKAQRTKRRKRRAERVDIQFAAVPVKIEAASEGGSLPTFSATAYSGGKLFVRGFNSPVVVDLDGLEVNANATILLDHDSTKRVGHPDSITVRDGKIFASGVISAENEHAQEVINSTRNGFRWQVSIGARPTELKRVEAGKSAVVNGRRQEGPFVLATRSKLNEISFVGSGGDEDNQVSIAAQSGKNLKEDDLNMENKDVSNQTDSTKPEDTKAEEVVLAQSTNAAVNIDASTVTTTNDIQAFRDQMANEITRANEISAICKEFPEIYAQSIKEGWDASRAELEVLRQGRNRPDNDVEASSGGPFIQSRVSADRNTAGQAVEASLCMQFGMPEEKVGKHFDEQTMNLAASAEYRGLGLHYLMYQTIRAAGGHYRPGVMDNDTIQSFLRSESSIQASSPGTFSHLTTSGILSNVANKMLLESFLAVETTIPTIFGRKTVTDFKQNSSYRLAADGELLEIPAGGEIKLMDLDEESFTNQAKTWGRMITLTRKDMINDDLGAFERIPRLLGRKAALKLEKEGWKTILGNAGSFFSAGNGNLLTGANSTLQISSLTTAEQTFMDQVDEVGDPIMLAARYLVTGTALATPADTLMGESSIIMESRNTSATTAKAVPRQNPHAGKWESISSPYANAQGLTGSSATKWWLFSDPSDVPAFCISYLNGRDTPQIESSDLHFNHLGMSWRCVFDFGVDQQDHRGAVQSDGA